MPYKFSFIRSSVYQLALHLIILIGLLSVGIPVYVWLFVIAVAGTYFLCLWKIPKLQKVVKEEALPIRLTLATNVFMGAMLCGLSSLSVFICLLTSLGLFLHWLRQCDPKAMRSPDYDIFEVDN